MSVHEVRTRQSGKSAVYSVELQADGSLVVRSPNLGLLKLVRSTTATLKPGTKTIWRVPENVREVRVGTMTGWPGLRLNRSQWFNALDALVELGVREVSARERQG